MWFQQHTFLEVVKNNMHMSSKNIKSCKCFKLSDECY